MVKRNSIRLLMSTVILLIYSLVRFVFIPEYPEYKIVTYVFFGGSFVYLLYYSIILFIDYIVKNKNDRFGYYIVFFFVLEIILYLLSEGSLIISIISSKQILMDLVYHLIPLLTFFMSKKLVSKDSR